MLELLSEYLFSRYAALFVPLAIFIALTLQRLKIYHDISFLGKRAPTFSARLPLGVDFIYHAVASFQANATVPFWEHIFQHSGASKTSSYTAEVFVLNSIRVLFTANPENVKAILTTQFADYGKGVQFHREWKDFLGDGIFNVDGARWSNARQLIRPMFVRDRVGDLVLFETHVQKLISLCGSGDNRLTRMDELLSRFTLDASTHFLLGKSVDSLEQEGLDFMKAFNDVQQVQGLKIRAGVARFLVPQKKFYDGLAVMEKFLEPYIQQALAMTPAELEEKVSTSDTLLHALARFTRDRKVIRDQLVSVLLAGRDSTASSLSWTFLELAKNPRVVEKLRAEIHEHLGSSRRPPSYQEIKDMKYVNYILNETLRLYPVVPYNVREALTDTTLPVGAGPTGMDPIGIKKGTGIGYSVLLMHRRRDLYPPISDDFPYDPLTWVPERWATWTPKSWQYLPFNGGPRICIGQNFGMSRFTSQRSELTLAAMTEMAYVLIRFFQTFETMHDYGNKPILKAEIVLTPGEGVKVGFGRSSPLYHGGAEKQS